MLDFQFGKLWVAVFTSWGQWFGWRWKQGCDGYRFWWYVGPVQVRWGEHDRGCRSCTEKYSWWKFLNRDARLQIRATVLGAAEAEACLRTEAFMVELYNEFRHRSV